MLSLNLWEHHFPTKSLYSVCVEPVCRKHGITRTELDILLFLANNPQYDTAAEIVEIRCLAKSHVSTSIKALEQSGFLKKYYLPDNKKTVHLSICREAQPVIDDGRKAQEHFFQVMFAGLSQEEIQLMQTCFSRIQENIKKYLEVHDL